MNDEDELIRIDGEAHEADIGDEMLDNLVTTMYGHIHNGRRFTVVDLGNGPECAYVHCDHPHEDLG